MLLFDYERKTILFLQKINSNEKSAEKFGLIKRIMYICRTHVIYNTIKLQQIANRQLYKLLNNSLNSR